MEFIKIMLQHSVLTEAKLHTSAQKAAKNPETGITINHQASYHVIKDCAMITTKYLPHMVFGAYKDPFVDLKGKFTRKSITEFVNASKSDVPVEQLLQLIVARAEKMNINTKPAVASVIKTAPVPADPYGDYGCLVEDTTPPPMPTDDGLVSILCKLFAVTT